MDAPLPEPVQNLQSVKFGADLTPEQVLAINLLIEEKRIAFA